METPHYRVRMLAVVPRPRKDQALLPLPTQLPCPAATPPLLGRAESRESWNRRILERSELEGTLNITCAVGRGSFH